MPITTHDELALLEDPFQEIERKIDILLTIGDLLMVNGASSNQITRDVYRIATYLGIPEGYAHLHISYATLMLNISGKNKYDHPKSYTSFHKVEYHSANMTIIAQVNQLTWDIFKECLTLEEIEKCVYRIKSLQHSPYSPHFAMIAGSFACGAFPLLFGGPILSAWITTFCALVGYFTRDWLLKNNVNPYISIACGAFMASSLAFMSHEFFTVEPVIYAMICCTLFMIPGIPLINAVDDLFHNHLVSGMTRASHTILIVGSMTVGIAMSQYFNSAYDVSHLSIIPETLHFIIFAASIVGSVGYAIMFRTPKYFLPYIGIGGFLSVGIKNILIIYFNFSIIGATLISAIILSLLTLKLSRHIKTSSLIIAIPSVIPLVPGVFLYRFIFAILHINTLTSSSFLEAIQSGITAILIIFAIAVGISIPNIVAGKFIDAKKAHDVERYLRIRTNKCKHSHLSLHKN